jgi:hypothetical protein
MVNPLDIRDISIIDAMPVYECGKRVLTVGCGLGRLEWHIHNMGYSIVATDIKRMVTWKDVNPSLCFSKMNILDKKTFIKGAPIVICSQVLEHLSEYKAALKNLLGLAGTRLIITIPFEKSFNSPGHVNRWDEKNVKKFESICKPYSVSISKIRTKPPDAKRKQWAYLIVVDKRQCYE